MAEQFTFREMIAYRPLLYAWIWELVCMAGFIYFALTSPHEAIMIGLGFAGAVPFGIAMLLFLRARKRGELGPKPGNIVE